MADYDSPPAPSPRPYMEVSSALKLPAHVAAGAKALRGWDDLSPVTEAQVTAAVSDFNSISLGR